MYAILDIETTGGKYNEEGITEIAIYQFDGEKITDQFASLLNPERPIQPFVVSLTGISTEMLRHAPKFYEVAKRIIEITEGCILVAHNAQFDNRILTTEFDRLGYPFQKNTLCTVALSKKLIPNQPSYSLGKLVRSLGIPISDRHRAQGDAKATLLLFKLLLEKDTHKTILSTLISSQPKRQLDSKLLSIIEKAPAQTGVYYMHKEDGTVIYIGKSKHIKKRLNQHFTSDTRKSKQIQRDVHAVTYEYTGNELIALLKENDAIKKLKPIYNRALRRTFYSYQLTSFKDENGYINLAITKADGRQNALTTFNNYPQAKNFLHKITDTHQLCQKLTGLHTHKGACFAHNIKACLGACLQEETPKSYNARVTKCLNTFVFKHTHMLIIDKGRALDEQAVILIEKGELKGYAFFNLNHQITQLDILRSILTPLPHNRDAQHIIQQYLRKHKHLKCVPLPS